MAAGSSAATCSISTPPLAETMARWAFAPRSRVKLA